MNQNRVLTSEVVKNAVNKHGELHLDVELTKSLIRMIELDENIIEGAEKFAREIRAEPEVSS